MLLCNVEGKVEVMQRIVLGELGVVEQVWPVSVDEGTESQAILRGRTWSQRKEEREREKGKNMDVSLTSVVSKHVLVSYVVMQT